MVHVDTKTTANKASHPDWLQVGSQIGALVNKISGRYDLVTAVGPEAGSSAPACFKPLIAEVEVNTNVAFGEGVTPRMVGDINERPVQYEFPKAVGAIMHEAFHARFSMWDLSKAGEALKEDEFQALVLLEESRIEKFGLDLDPRNRAFLRASALEIAIGDIEGFEGGSVQQLAQMVGLVHGRVIADVLDIDEVGEIIDTVNSSLGQDTVDKLTTILRAFQKHEMHANLDPVYDLAREWAKIVRELSEERGETENEVSSAGMEKLKKDLLEKLSDAAESIGVKNYSELLDQEQDEEWKEEVSERAESSKERTDNEKVATEIFGSGTGPDSSKRTRSTLQETRKPKGAERSAAVTIARLLEKAKYRERDMTEVASVVPPGRLRTKALVQSAALKDRGVFQTVEPWRRTVRKHTDNPNLTVGVMVDISGSMYSAMEPMATTAWVMSEATRRVQGKCAMVYYGSDVFATLKPGQHLTDVSVYTAPDGTEKFDKAFKALDGSLNLLHGSGARLLVVVSDGEYVSEETKAARKWLSRCEQAGVAVLWLPFDHGRSAERTINGARGVSLIAGQLDPTEAASQIGQEAAKLLTKVGQRNA